MAKDIDEFEILRRKAKQQTTAEAQRAGEGIRRRFAALGGLQSGAAIKQEQLAREAVQRRGEERMGAIDIAQAREERRQKELGEERAFRREEAQAGREFAREQARLGREFGRGEREASQAFASEEAIAQRAFQAEEARLGRQLTEAESVRQRDFASAEAQKQRDFAKRQGLTAFDQQKELQRLGAEAQRSQIELSQQGALELAGVNAEAATALEELRQEGATNLAQKSIDAAAEQQRLERELKTKLSDREFALAEKEFEQNIETIFLTGIQNLMTNEDVDLPQAVQLLEEMKRYQRGDTLGQTVAAAGDPTGAATLATFGAPIGG